MLEPTGTVPTETMLGVASSAPPVLTVWACVLPAPIPSVARSKNPQKTRAPSLFFLDRQTLGGKVSGRPDRKKLQRKTVDGPVSLTACSGYRRTQMPGYWPEEANAYSLVFPTVARSLTCPFGQGQNAKLMLPGIDGVIMRSQIVRWLLPDCESRDRSRPLKPGPTQLTFSRATRQLPPAWRRKSATGWEVLEQEQKQEQADTAAPWIRPKSWRRLQV